jgi:hypothetical protein
MTPIPPQRKRRRFVRDVEIHGHHKGCTVDYNGACICVELDHDDWIAAGEREYNAWKENGHNKEKSDE